ncbi:hypothetical protein Q3G72_000876 [Acer saccharum]|nr:hypothetical protein Q3G72_000876 [Acer saccharum]
MEVIDETDREQRRPSLGKVDDKSLSPCFELEACWLVAEDYKANSTATGTALYHMEMHRHSSALGGLVKTIYISMKQQMTRESSL